MTLAMTLNLIAVLACTLLLSALVVLYAGMLREVRAPLTWGLFIFSLTLLAQHAVQLYFFATMMEYYAGNVEVLVLVQNVLVLLAVAFLTIVTLRPGGLSKRAGAPTTS